MTREQLIAALNALLAEYRANPEEFVEAKDAGDDFGEVVANHLFKLAGV